MSVHSIGRRAPARRDAIPRFREAAAAERALNAALLAADITNGFEDFLDDVHDSDWSLGSRRPAAARPPCPGPARAPGAAASDF